MSAITNDPRPLLTDRQLLLLHDLSTGHIRGYFLMPLSGDLQALERNGLIELVEYTRLSRIATVTDFGRRFLEQFIAERNARPLGCEA